MAVNLLWLICVLLLVLFHVTAYFSTTYYLILFSFTIYSTVLFYKACGLNIFVVLCISAIQVLIYSH